MQNTATTMSHRQNTATNDEATTQNEKKAVAMATGDTIKVGKMKTKGIKFGPVRDWGKPVLAIKGKMQYQLENMLGWEDFEGIDKVRLRRAIKEGEAIGQKIGEVILEGEAWEDRRVNAQVIIKK